MKRFLSLLFDTVLALAVGTLIFAVLAFLFKQVGLLQDELFRFLATAITSISVILTIRFLAERAKKKHYQDWQEIEKLRDETRKILNL